jgi:hypothetical protein
MATRQKRSEEASYLRQPASTVGRGLSRKPLATPWQPGETPRLRDPALTILWDCPPRSPCGERGSEPSQACRPSLRPCEDATDGNVGTTCHSPPFQPEGRGGQPASRRGKSGGAPVVVRDGESPSHGEAGQSDTVHSSRQIKRESGREHRSMIAQKQRALALWACQEPSYRFDGLYNLLHWEKWLHCAAQTVLRRPGSDTAGVDGTTRAYFKEHYERSMTELREDLKRGRFVPQPARRVYIPKAKGKKRLLGILVLRDRIVQEAMRMALDPIYESDFQSYSFRFRKGRRTMDAIAVLMPLFNRQTRHYYVIEGDLQNYFDTVNHRKLLSILRRRIKDRKLLALIWQFLKAGVMDGGLFATTPAGVQQGGILTPPTMLRTASLRTQHERVSTDAKHYRYFLFVNLDPTHQGPNNLPLRLPIGRDEAPLHLSHNSSNRPISRRSSRCWTASSANCCSWSSRAVTRCFIRLIRGSNSAFPISPSAYPSSLNNLPRRTLRWRANRTMTMGMCRLSSAFPAGITTTAIIQMTTLVLHLLPYVGPSRQIPPVCLGVRPICPLGRATCRLGRVGHGRRKQDAGMTISVFSDCICSFRCIGTETLPGV